MITFLDTLSTLFSLIYGWFFYRLLGAFAPIRQHWIWKVLAYIGCLYMVPTVIFKNDPVNIYFLFIGFILYMQIFYQGGWVQKLSAVMILYPVLVSVNYITEDIGYIIWLQNPSMSLLQQTALHTLLLFTRVPIWGLLCYFLHAWIQSAGKNLTVKMWIVLDLVCLASFIGITLLLLYTPEDLTYICYPACAACFLTSIGCIYLSAYISKTVKADMELKNYKIQESYYQELESNQKSLRKLRHDMNHHLSVIHTFLEQGNLEHAKGYFQDLSGHFAVGSRTFCKNSIVNAVINSKYNLAASKQINCFFHIDLDHFINMDNISLCSLFANTLDNAIEASSQIADEKRRNIEVKSRFLNGYFSYEITNTKANPVKEKKGRFLTTKSDTASHGFGLQTVKDIVTDYQGTLDITYDDTSFTLVVLIGNMG